MAHIHLMLIDTHGSRAAALLAIASFCAAGYSANVIDDSAEVLTVRLFRASDGHAFVIEHVEECPATLRCPV